MLCDISNKDQSLLKINTPKTGLTSERPTFPSSRQTSPKLITLITPDLAKSIEAKNQQIGQLKETKASLTKEIKQARKYIKENKDLSVTVLEKDKKLKELKAQLSQIEQEIERILLWKKSHSIPNINQTRPTTQQPSKTEGSPIRENTKSLSPNLRGVQKDKKKERYKMYKENPAKAFLAQYLKARTPRVSRDQLQPLLLGDKRKDSNKYVQFSPEIVSKRRNNVQEQSRKLHCLLAELITPTPRTKVVTKVRESHETSDLKQRESRKEAPKVIEERREKERELKSRRETENDVSTQYSILLGKYASAVEKYKEKSKLLSKRNKELERKVIIMDLKTNNISVS